MPNEPRLKEPAPVIERYEALLQMADLIAGRLTLPELFHELSTRVREVADCSFVTFILHDPLKNVMRIQLWEGAEVPDMPSELMMEHSASGWVWSNQKPLLMPNLESEDRFPAIHDFLRAAGVKSY